MNRTEGYRGPQVCKIVGITYRQLDYWARTDLIRPSLADADGSGSQRLYGYTDLVQLKIIKEMLDSGIKLQNVRTAIDYLKKEVGEDLSSANLVLDGSRMFLVHDNKQLIDIIQGGQGVLSVIPVSRPIQEIDAAIEALVNPGQIAKVETEPVKSNSTSAAK